MVPDAPYFFIFRVVFLIAEKNGTIYAITVFVDYDFVFYKIIAETRNFHRILIFSLSGRGKILKTIIASALKLF